MSAPGRGTSAGAAAARRPFAVAGAVLVLGLAYAVLAGWLAPYDARPGAPVGQSLGIAAACLMIAALLYLPAKRSEVVPVANRRLVVAHIVLGVVGAGVALAHSRLVVSHPPILVLLAFLGLLGSGYYGRVVGSRRMGPTFGRGGSPFRPVPGPPPELRALIERKRRLLVALEPIAAEGTFALALSHWVWQPARAARYYALSVEERCRVRALSAAGYEAEMGALERWWRIGHLALAGLAVVGLVAHVVTVLFFAQWAAGDRPVYWWHVRW